jgi:hypothetical protein
MIRITKAGYIIISYYPTLQPFDKLRVTPSARQLSPEKGSG